MRRSDCRTRASSLLVTSAARRTRGYRPFEWTLGAWRWVALCLVLCVVALGLVLPVWSLISWWGRTSLSVDLWALFTGPLVNSLVLSFAAGLAVVLLALPIGLLSSRHASPLATLIERVTHVGFGLPGIVVGLSLVFLALKLIPALYQTWFVVVLGFRVRNSLDVIDKLERRPFLGSARSTREVIVAGILLLL